MMPAPTLLGWALMILPPNGVSADRIAKVKLEHGRIVQAFAIEREPWRPFAPKRRLHWVAGIGSWEVQ